MTILIVDDSAPMRKMVREYLSHCSPGATVVECEAGEGALAAYGLSRPDWTFMDVRMGAVDGITATRAIRASYPDARIVMLTQYDDADLRTEAFGAGAAGYCVKDNLTEIGFIISQVQH